MIIRRRLLRHSGRLLWQQAHQASRRSFASETRQNEATIASQLNDVALLQSQASKELDELSRPLKRRRTPEIDPLIEAYHTSKHIENTTGSFGSAVDPAYQPQELLLNPPRPSDVTLELLLASQAHLGHSTSLWNPANSRYIFGIREGIHIISLEATASHLRRAAKIVSGVAEHGGIVLFVGTRPGQDRCVVKAAELTGGCHLFERWTPGSITNGEQILGKCARRLVNEFDEEIPGYEEQLQERSVLKPDLVVCMNTLENEVMLHECALANIPTIGVIDTDANPTWVTYPIPANDDSLRCIQVIAGVLGRAGEEGRLRRLEAAKNGIVNYNPASGLARIEAREHRDTSTTSSRNKNVHMDHTDADGYLRGAHSPEHHMETAVNKEIIGEKDAQGEIDTGGDSSHMRTSVRNPRGQ